MKLVAPRVSWGQLEQRLEWDLLFQRQQSTLQLEREHRLPFRSGLSAEIRDAQGCPAAYQIKGARLPVHYCTKDRSAGHVGGDCREG